MKFALVVMCALVLALGVSGTALAFHEGGVAYCDGCHSMHGALTPATGALGQAASRTGGGYAKLLKGADASSACLNCHESATQGSYRVSTSGTTPLQLGPGGDFSWLKKTLAWTVPRAGSENGETRGHNIVATNYNYTADPTKLIAPGGSFSASSLACTSCHDPHGKFRRDNLGNVSSSGTPIIGPGSYASDADPAAGQAVGVYRLLAGAGYTKGPAGSYLGVPMAVAPDSYNRSEATTQTRVAYGRKDDLGHTSWGQWCGACHTTMATILSTEHRHPVDRTMNSGALPSSMATQSNYNAYVMTGNMTGSIVNSFTSLVPFIEGSGVTYATLRSHAMSDDSQLGGPSTNDEVSCMTCHRAHASGFGNALRWEGNAEFLTFNGAYPDNATEGPLARGKSVAEITKAYYDRPATVFATYQRSLCNKCHAQD